MKSIAKTDWIKNPIKNSPKGLSRHNQIELSDLEGKSRIFNLRHTNYLIGTNPDAHIQICDPFVSGRHAMLEMDKFGEYHIKDLNSKNGIYLNGTKIKAAKLPANARLKIGRSTLCWKHKTNSDEKISGFLTVDKKLEKICEHLLSIANSNIPVLLLGETGTGKDLLANAIHTNSQRAHQDLIAVNCAFTEGSLVDSELFGHSKGAYTGAEKKRIGAIMSANRGTLFLDEIGELPLSVQAKLLRCLEQGEAKALGEDEIQYSDFRLISATNRSMYKRIQDLDFRSDLFYRISGVVVEIPALRNRKNDVVYITENYLKEQDITISDNAKNTLLLHNWPGNVRELLGALKRACLFAKIDNSRVIENRHIVLSEGEVKNINNNSRIRSLVEVEKEAIIVALKRCGWSRKVASQKLGIARSTLFEKMKRYNINDLLQNEAMKVSL